MASENKKRKLKNSHACPGQLKNKIDKGPKTGAFFTSSQRRQEKIFER
jgi:hypothetical protein